MSDGLRFVTGMRLRICVALLPVLCPTAFALNPGRSVLELHHTAWTVADGAPTNIQALAQTSDGYLWIGTVTGLFRFDGVRFERFEDIFNTQLPSNEVYSLWAPRSGGLWIGFRLGGASFFKNGRITNYSDRDGLPTGAAVATSGFAQDSEGTIWAATSGGLMRLDGQHWSAVGAERHYSGKYVRQVFVDKDGTLWVTGSDTVSYLRRGARFFEEAGIRAYYPFIAQSSEGTLWLADTVSGVRLLNGSAEAGAKGDPWIIHARSRQVLIDRDGSAWCATYEGIFRVRLPISAPGTPAGHTVAEAFESERGLSSNRVLSVLEDREGNIWFGTFGGLDRFREVPLVRVPTPPEARYFSIVGADAGAMWIGTLGQGLLKSGNPIEAVAGGPRAITCLYRDSQGVLWVGGDKSLWRFAGNSWVRVPLPDDISSPLVVIQAIVEDRQGGVWVSVEQEGVYRFAAGAWTRLGNQIGLPRLTAITAAIDPHGRIWFGYSYNRAALLDGASVRNFSVADGLHVGNVMALDAHAEHVWVGGELGLARFDGSRFQTIVGAGGRNFGSISGIVETANRDLWFNAARGIVHIAAAELRHNQENPEYPVQFTLFDFQDGLPGTLQGTRPLPTVALGTDGRLWFTATDGVAWLDPDRIRRNPIAPPVWIQSIDADGRRELPTNQLRLPLGTRNLQIDYTALSLSIPERVRFRYRLEGADTGWQHAGARRVAFYTNLGPGHYRFRVAASNNDGVWNDTGDSLSFVIPPAFYQTNWFLALCIAGAAGILWVLYLLRLRQLTARVRGRLEERLAERDRIARELHDTLLQGMQGFILRFHALSQRVPENEPTRALMKGALDRAQQVLVDARDRVSGLRGSQSGAEGLLEPLTLVGEELAKDYPTVFQATVQGQQRELHPVVREEAHHIGVEALINAFRHAGAARVELEITFERAELRLRIRDDGKGIDPATLTAGDRPGHWGLVGMRERAGKIRASMDIWSRHGAGTEVELRVPAAMAYCGRAKRTRWS